MFTYMLQLSQLTNLTRCFALGVGDAGFTEWRFPRARFSDQRGRLRDDLSMGQRGAALQDQQSPGQIQRD